MKTGVSSPRGALRIRMEYIRPMWLRSALTSLLAAILLCVSCAASTCAVECEMSALRVAGHSCSEHSSAATGEVIHRHCGHGAVFRSTSPSAVAPEGTQMGRQCVGEFCAKYQIEAINKVGYRLNAPMADSFSSGTTPGVSVFRQIGNYTVSDLRAHPPPRYSDVLRL